MKAWRFYGFNDIYGCARLDYLGPQFGWFDIPDEFALAKLDAEESNVEPRKPLFVFFPTISTHTPFRPTPPYQPDWQRMLTNRPFDQGDLDLRHITEAGDAVLGKMRIQNPTILESNGFKHCSADSLYHRTHDLIP